VKDIITVAPFFYTIGCREGEGASPKKGEFRGCDVQLGMDFGSIGTELILIV